MKHYPPLEAKLFIPRTRKDVQAMRKISLTMDILRYLKGERLLVYKDLNTKGEKIILYQEILKIFER